jgi:hypothetical protein
MKRLIYAIAFVLAAPTAGLAQQNTGVRFLFDSCKAAAEGYVDARTHWCLGYLLGVYEGLVRIHRMYEQLMPDINKLTESTIKKNENAAKAWLAASALFGPNVCLPALSQQTMAAIVAKYGGKYPESIHGDDVYGLAAIALLEAYSCTKSASK